jgi:c-di-GMP-related signal transduction protein
MVSIREFIRNFFLCEECVTHFVNMTSNVENEIHSFDETVIYLWQSKLKTLLVLFKKSSRS